jgi:diguanylate cyclase (GGDEF)-like protein
LANSVSEWGYEPVITRDGQEAWAVLASEQNNGSQAIQIAILDWQMPRLDGVELCRRIRSQDLTCEQAYVYIILLTGRDHQEDILRGLNAGADDYLTKPFDQVELQIRLKNGVHALSQEQQALDLTVTDRLTKLWKQDKIVEFLEDELDRNSRLYLPTGLILADVDNLNKINEKHGRTAGDRLLADIGKSLKDTIRRYDRLGRFGDDEFMLVLPNCGKAHLSVIAERLRRVVAGIRTIEFGLDPTISLGCISSQYSLTSSGQNLINSAQKAVQEAKRQGRDRVVRIDQERTV